MEEQVRYQGSNGRRKRAALVLFFVIVLMGGVSVLLYLNYKRTHISTDDAFVEGRIHTVASKVSGTVKAVFAGDNAAVKKGDVLVEIDPADYDVRVQEADAGVKAERARLGEAEKRVEVAGRQMEELRFRVEAAGAYLHLQEANLRQAGMDLERAKGLIEKEAIPRDRFDRTKTAYDVAAAQVKAARDQLRQTEAAVETQKALIRQAGSSLSAQVAAVSQREATLSAARLSQGYTRIYAPIDGYVTKRSVESGNQVQAGQPLMAVVPLDDIWGAANYKETQLQKIRPGQRVEIRADGYPGKVFRGRVESIMAGTGSVFSLFPPENATGNFVKVVQRVPVKIVLEENTDKEHVLRLGMSVVPTVIVK